jgi:hypothetical protein
VSLNTLLKKISFETFSDIIAKSPRKVRESLYSHYGIKNKNIGILKSIKDKKIQRVQNLFNILQNAQNTKEHDFLKELFRNWLFYQRPLLKATLDHLGVENDFGLVEIETDFFKELKEAQVKELISTLEPNFSKDAIRIYFTIMEVPNLDNVM